MGAGSTWSSLTIPVPSCSGEETHPHCPHDAHSQGRASGSPEPPGLGSTHGESQKGRGWVGRGLSMGPGSQLLPVQLSPLLRTVMLLRFGFTLGQPRGVPAQYIPSCLPPPAHAEPTGAAHTTATR